MMCAISGSREAEKDGDTLFISLALLVLATVPQSHRLRQNNFLKIWIN